METYRVEKALVENWSFALQRRACLAGLRDEMIDAPIRPLIRALNELPWCFSLQSCYGHFLYPGQSDPHNLEPPPSAAGPDTLTYRIAYLAICVDNTDRGERLLGILRRIPRLDPENIQFGSADWFWNCQVNSYILQVEPDRFKGKDQANLDLSEAIKIAQLRKRFFKRLGEVV